MELYQLSYFCEIAKTQNLSKAAEHLNVSQPTLTRVIQKLEEELDTPLFDRTGNMLQINEAGKIFAMYASQIGGSVNDAIHAVKNYKETVAIPLHIAVINDNGLIPDLLTAFREHYPAIKVNVNHFTSLDTMHYQCSLLIHASNEILEEFPMSKKLFTEECFIGIPAGHPLAEKECLELSDLMDQPLILLKQNNSFAAFSRSFITFTGLLSNVVMECSSQFLIDSMVIRGNGLALYPSRTWRADSKKVVLKRIRNHPLYQPLFISCTKKMPDYSTELFYSFVSEYCRNLKD